MAAVTGSGYGGSLYAGYSAWNAAHAPDAPAMEYMSMPHSRSATLHLQPQLRDTLVSNLREPMLTFVEDTSPGVHDTLIAACDPQRYKGLGVDNWEQHGSCAENLVLALKELNERAGLKGAKSVGSEVTINSVPAPLNLFMNVPWDDEGDLGFQAPKSKEGDFVRMKAERDIVVVMSACPQDVSEINNKKPTDAHFIVEVEGEEREEAKPAQSQPAKKRPAPRKIASSRTTSVADTDATANAIAADDAKLGAAPAKKPVPARKAPTGPSAAKKAPAPTSASQPAAARKKPVPSKPAPPQEQKKASSAGPVEADANGSGDAPKVEKKKPRKLASRPKAEGTA